MIRAIVTYIATWGVLILQIIVGQCWFATCFLWTGVVGSCWILPCGIQMYPGPAAALVRTRGSMWTMAAASCASRMMSPLDVIPWVSFQMFGFLLARMIAFEFERSEGPSKRQRFSCVISAAVQGIENHCVPRF